MGEKILVVDDEEDILMMVEARLSASGYKIITAGDGNEGLQKATAEKPDLIISDVVMPKMDGFAFYKALKSDKNLCKIPVLILTARGKMEDSFRVMGVDDFITKPFDSHELINTVRAKLTQSSQSVGISDLPKKADPQPKKKEPEPAAQTPPVDNDQPKEGQIRVFVVSLSEKVSRIARKALNDEACHCLVADLGEDLIKQAEKYSPDICLLDVFVNQKPSTDVIIRMKKSRVLRKVTLLIYSYLDKDSLGDVSANQRRMELENAKVACLNAGAKDVIGDFDKDGLMKVIQKYLKP